MRRIVAILFLAVPCFAASPKYRQDDPLLQDEIVNVYKTIGNVLVGDVRISSVTITTATITNLKGVTDGSSACLGCIGQIISATQGVQSVPTTNQYGDAASISLTPGNWLVFGSIYFGINSGTWSLIEIGVSAGTGNNFADEQFGLNAVFWNYANSATTPLNMVVNFAPVVIRVTTTTTYNLKMLATYTAGTPRANFSSIEAVRFM